MRPDQPCIATATYAPHCGCPVRLEVKRGDDVPVCPNCKSPVEWRFLSSAYAPSALPTEPLLALTGAPTVA